MFKEESSVIGVLGRRGHGKTTLLALLGEHDYSNGKKVIANFDLSFPYFRMSFADIIELPEELQDATLLLDEMQVGAGAREALKKTNQTINKFITQLRKRNILLIYSTQNFMFIDKSIRSQTDFLVVTEKTATNGIYKVITVDRNDFTDSAFGSVINVFKFNANDLYNRNVFNTNEIVNFEDEEVNDPREEVVLYEQNEEPHESR